jgi:hypothetical protein
MADVFLVYANSSVHLVAWKMEYTTPCLSEKVMPRGWIQREDSDLHRATERRVVEPIEGVDGAIHNDRDSDTSI